MKKFFWFVVILITVMLGVFVFISKNTNSKSNQQLIVVTAKDWNSFQGVLQRYERGNEKQPWHKVGSLIPVVVGKNGMAWDAAHVLTQDVPTKKEGDGRSPMGIFSFGTAFGFAMNPTLKIKLSYLPLTSNTVCVDDAKSIYYNTIIDSSKVEKSSWNSGEEMQTKTPYYTWGAVVNYNNTHPMPGAGSCIFMHQWKSSEEGTSGCVAMSGKNIPKVLTWLDPNKKPVIAIFPYHELIAQRYLPNPYPKLWNGTIFFWPLIKVLN